MPESEMTAISVGAAADIDHHVAARLGDGQTGADGGYHGLLDQEHFTSLGAIGGILDRALFYLGDLRRHADDNPGVHQHFAVVRLLDKVIQHLFRDFEVGDHAIFHGLDGHDVAGRAAKHLLGLFTHRLDLAGVFVDRHDRGLVDHDTLTARIHQGVRGA